MASKKAVPLELDTHAKLVEICKKKNTTIKDFTAQMVDYFYRTGIDPSAEANTNLKEAIKELRKENNRVIGFIKQQEKTKLNPILDQMAVGYNEFKSNAGALNTVYELEEQLGKVLRNQQRLSNEINRGSIDSIMKARKLFADYLKEQEWGKAIGIGKYVKDPTILNETFQRMFSVL